MSFYVGNEYALMSRNKEYKYCKSKPNNRLMCCYALSVINYDEAVNNVWVDDTTDDACDDDELRANE
jgi:hypothetical protein